MIRGRHRILVINPDQELIAQLSRMIEEKGGEVLGTSDPQEGIQRACQESFDLVLWVLKDREEEIAAIRKLTQESHGKIWRVALVSEKTPSIRLLHFLRRFGLDFILKPSTPEELAETLQRLLSGGAHHG